MVEWKAAKVFILNCNSPDLRLSHLNKIQFNQPSVTCAHTCICTVFTCSTNTSTHAKNLLKIVGTTGRKEDCQDHLNIGFSNICMEMFRSFLKNYLCIRYEISDSNHCISRKHEEKNRSCSYEPLLMIIILISVLKPCGYVKVDT